MRRSRFTDEQIVEILKEGINCTSVNQLCYKFKISQGTYYKWRAKYKTLDTAGMKRLRFLEKRNRQLKELYFRVCREKSILQEAIEGKL